MAYPAIKSDAALDYIAKQVDIKKACDNVDIDALLLLASSRDGLTNDHLRRLACSFWIPPVCQT